VRRADQTKVLVLEPAAAARILEQLQAWGYLP
jgi:hypothetical protein